MPPKRKAAAASVTTVTMETTTVTTEITSDDVVSSTTVSTTRASKRTKVAKEAEDHDADKKVTAAKTEEGDLTDAAKGKKPAPTPRGKAKKVAAEGEAKKVAAEEEEEEEKKGKGAKGGKGKGKATKATAATGEAGEEGEREGGSESQPLVPLLPVEMPTSYSYVASDPAHLKIVSYNLDGFRSACDNKMTGYCEAEDADVVCFQETKMNDPPIFMNLKYPHQYWSCSSAKKGYAGTAILSKVKPVSISYGLGKKEHDEEGRTIIAEFEDFYLVNTYVPNSGQKLERLPYRATWDADLQAKLQELDKKKPVVWTGDLNVAHTEIDLTNPKTNKRTAGFTAQERESFGKLLDLGFVDSFRAMNPDKKDQYSFWGKRFQARAKNLGWRLDYFVMSQRFMERVAENLIRPEVWGASDHVPIVLILKGLKFLRK